ncbi:MAG: hypothetical protein WCW30_03755 [Candidatus Gracilibacteria bacterium]|jgi:hypothetical protein
MKKIGAFAGLCLVVLMLVGCKTTGTTGDNNGAIDSFAKCLTDNGMAFYGAYWCPHCQDQKKMFGDAFQYVNYVECDAGGENAQPEACVAAGIQYYPTWINAAGEMENGAQSFDGLAAMSGCTAPVVETTTDGE